MNLVIVVFGVFITGVREDPVTLIVMGKEEGCTEKKMEGRMSWFTGPSSAPVILEQNFLSMPGVPFSK